jgi:hypothetical protein
MTKQPSHVINATSPYDSHDAAPNSQPVLGHLAVHGQAAAYGITGQALQDVMQHPQTTQ